MILRWDGFPPNYFYLLILLSHEWGTVEKKCTRKYLDAEPSGKFVPHSSSYFPGNGGSFLFRKQQSHADQSSNFLAHCEGQMIICFHTKYEQTNYLQLQNATGVVKLRRMDMVALLLQTCCAFGIETTKHDPTDSFAILDPQNLKFAIVGCKGFITVKCLVGEEMPGLSTIR